MSWIVFLTPFGAMTEEVRPDMTPRRDVVYEVPTETEARQKVALLDKLGKGKAAGASPEPENLDLFS